MSEVVWRVQAHWSVGGEAKFYAPLFAATEVAAFGVAEEMEATLGHFPTLEIRVEPVKPSAADAELVSDKADLPGQRPMLHVFADEGRGTMCGAEIDVDNGAMAVELLDLPDGDKCVDCLTFISGLE